MLDVSDRDSHWRVIRLREDGVPATQSYFEHWRRQFGSFQSLPEKTRFAVASLRMCEPMERIAGVGQKVSEKTFWLDTTPAILKEYEEE